MNSVIGAGIFGLPSTIAASVGSYALFAYALGAAMAAITVAVVAELSSQFQEPGGAYLYVSDAFGPGLGTQTGWFSWLARITTAAAIANLLLNYLAGFFSVLAHPIARNTGAIIIVGGLAAINIQSARKGSQTSNVLAVIKLLPLIVLIAVGVCRWQRGTLPEHSMMPGWAAWSDALIAMVFAFSGFESAMIPGREIENPRENTPPAAFNALLLISVLYFSLHLVVMRVLPEMSSSERPLSDAAAIYLGANGRTTIAAAAIVCTFGWLSAAAFSAPRLTQAMAERGNFPEILARKSKKSDTPWVSIMFWAVLVIGLTSYGTFSWNVVLSVAARLVVYSTMCAAVLKLRKTHPMRAAWRIPFGSTVPLTGVLLCVVLATRLRADHLILMVLVSSTAFFTQQVRRWKREPARS